MVSIDRSFGSITYRRAPWRSVFLVFGLAVGSTVMANDADWPQWRGPNRDGRAAPQPLLKSWPESGPRLVWNCTNAGLGYSSVSTSNSRVFSIGQRGDECVAVCLDEASGKEMWAVPFDRGTKKNDYLTGWGGGPRSTPTIDGDLVYFLSDLGTLACLKATDGTKVWSTNLVKDLGGSIPKWGFSESVLIDGERVVATPGGTHVLVAFDKKTGDVLWKSTGLSEGAQYVSIMKGVFSGVPIYVTALASGLVGFHAETGELLFKNASTGNGVAVIPTPIIAEQTIYHSSGYQAGNALVNVNVDGGKVTSSEVYHFAKESMENHHGGYVLDQGTIFGFSRAFRGTWMAQELATGKVIWSKKVGKGTSGSITLADGMLYCYDDTDGICYLADISREGWSVKGQIKLPKETDADRQKGLIWAHPVVANKKLYIRDQDLIYAFDIGRN